MKFTPFGIKNQEFNKSVRGYDREEVKAFLEKLSDEFERLQNENDKLKSDFEKLEDQLKEYKRIEKNLQNAMLSATESTSKALDSAKKQSSLIIKEAELKAVQLVEKAKENADAIRDAVLKLREEKKVIIARLKAIVESQSDLFNLTAGNIETKPVRKKKPQVEESDKKEDQPDINVDDILERLL
jgi:cell division initiation protein